MSRTGPLDHKLILKLAIGHDNINLLAARRPRLSNEGQVLSLERMKSAFLDRNFKIFPSIDRPRVVHTFTNVSAPSVRAVRATLAIFRFCPAGSGLITGSAMHFGQQAG
jgi:hypothetical protein